MSSADSSPLSRFSGSDIDFSFASTFDPNYTAEISNKMRVPKKIRVVGGHEAEGGTQGSDEMNGNWNPRKDKVQMQVPDRIMVTGHESHVGSKALPRELQLETVVMPPDAEHIRIQTPPRSITLHSGPQHARPESETSYRSEDDDETLVVETGGGDSRFEQGSTVNGGKTVFEGLGVSGNTVAIARRGKRSFTTVLGEENDEIEHLREQMSRMNRRLLALEEDSSDRKEKERYLVMAGLLYVAYKTCVWLFKGNAH